MRTLQVVFDGHKNYYEPGDVISGCILIQSSKPIKARKVTIDIVGYSDVKWTEVHWYMLVFNYLSCTTYTSRYMTLGVSRTMWQKENGSEIPAGETRFPFAYTLPLEIPPTFGGWSDGKIYYKVNARIDIENWSDKTVSLPIWIGSRYDLNLVEGGSNRIGLVTQESCGFLNSDRVHIRIQLDKSAYAIGEKISCTVNVENPVNRHIKSIELKLLQTTVFWIQNETKSGSKYLPESSKSELSTSPESTSITTTKTLTVPDTPSSFDASNISVSYELVVRLRINGKVLDDYPIFKLPIKIGTIPINIYH